ncbi:MAG: Ditrans,polycis-undecaprenyl-diphosphate synthase ((2E,6E)-farnesyl-diphosphate specific) [Legionellaceae bacterium]
MNKDLPKHIAIIMDGNGRWAKRQLLPRFMGHQAGLEAVRTVAKLCGQKEIEYLTLFAFSSENWHRPSDEVNYLMKLFLNALEKEAKRLHKNNIQLRIIGSQSRFSAALKEKIAAIQTLTAHNNGLKLSIAADYGGRWDIMQAIQQLMCDVSSLKLTPSQIDEKLFTQYLSTKDMPEPDLIIRTGGEQRISNFLLWQSAYAELFFTDVLWPDFSQETLNEALNFYAQRQRRFGKTSEQIESVNNA